MAAKMSTWIQWFWKVHPKLYRWSGGRIGNRLMNMPVLLLTTRGRRSGLPRTRALMYLPDGENFVVIASYLGEQRHPDWWLNMQAHPEAEVQVGRRHITVVPRETEGEERERWWKAVVERQKDYAAYQERTDRKFPIIVLEPKR